MTVASFDDLLQAARSQPAPQRLLFVFAGVELPEDATPAQRQGFEACTASTWTTKTAWPTRPPRLRCRPKRCRP